MPNKIIKDPVHGYIQVGDAALRLIDSPGMQRLRYIRQLGFSYLVYPGANHTRFEHSLGTMHLADIAAARFGLGEHERTLVSAAALLHDVGHGPFSHASEPLIRQFLHRTHDEIRGFVRGAFGDILVRSGIDPEELCAVVQGSHPLSGIIHGDLDVDRMDYLLRDAYYTGAPYGMIDASRLIRNMIRTDTGIVLDENGIGAAESLLVCRTLMRPSVYFHHVSRIAESMFQCAVMAHLGEGGDGDAGTMLTLDDAACMQRMLGSGSPIARGIAGRIYERRLYKRAVYVGRDQAGATAFQAEIPVGESRAIAAEIASAAGCLPHEVLVDIPSPPRDMSLAVRVKNRTAVVGFAEVSPRLQTLNEARREQWRLGVYTPPEHAGRVAEAAAGILHIRKPTRQDTLF